MGEGENRAVAAVTDALRPLGLPVDRLLTPAGVVLHVRAPEASYFLAPVWAGEGFTEDVRRALDRVAGRGSAAAEIPVVVATALSAGGRAAAEEAGAGWADEAGNARIVAPPALAVSREGAPATRGTATSGWSTSAGAVAELVLTRHVRDGSGDVPPISVIASSLDWSAAQVGKVLAFFDGAGWTIKEGPERGPTAGRRLADPAALLSAWAAWHAGRRRETYAFGAHIPDPAAFMRGELDEWLPAGSWCVTGWAALDLVAPFTTRVPSIDVYVRDSDVARALADASLHPAVRPVESGGRVNLLPAPPYVLTLAEAADALPVVSAVRLYGDLHTLGARGEEAADRLRETRIGF